MVMYTMFQRVRHTNKVDLIIICKCNVCEAHMDLILPY